MPAAPRFLVATLWERSHRSADNRLKAAEANKSLEREPHDSELFNLAESLPAGSKAATGRLDMFRKTWLIVRPISLCLDVFKSQWRTFGKISFCLSRVDGLDAGLSHFMQEERNRMVFWAGKSLKSMKLLIESETFLVGLTARWQICVKFHRIQRNHSASFSDILQGVSQWVILVFHLLALKQFSKLENFANSLPLTSLCSSILSFVLESICQAVCGWTPGRGGSRELSHACDGQRVVGRRRRDLTLHFPTPEHSQTLGITPITDPGEAPQHEQPRSHWAAHILLLPE